jgi:hypothetical protein
MLGASQWTTLAQLAMRTIRAMDVPLGLGSARQSTVRSRAQMCAQPGSEDVSGETLTRRQCASDTSREVTRTGNYAPRPALRTSRARRPLFALDGLWWRLERCGGRSRTPAPKTDECNAATPPSPARPQIARRRPGIRLGRARLTAGARHGRRTRARAMKLTAYGVALCGEI